jgi:hypothetical protein
MLSNLSTPILIISALAAAFFIAIWLSLIVWTGRDISERSRDPLIRILSIGSVVLLNYIGVVIYLILRPKATIAESFQQTLEEEALLQSLENDLRCPACGRAAKEIWENCPFCGTMLYDTCPACEHKLEMGWSYCAFCGKEIARVNVAVDEASSLQTVQTHATSEGNFPAQSASDELIELEDDQIDQL